ncbi:MAG TPA: phosphotransferase [Actinomycetota bacterium]|jgi:maltokinase|nr:phosphotransferase [Actinomycetota bacterium]
MTELESALAAFLPQQRWFSGKGRLIGEVRIEADVPLRNARPALHAVVAGVAYTDGGVERYHLPVGHDLGPEARSLLSRHPSALIMETRPPREGVYYDAVADERLGAVFLEMLSRGATLDQLRFHRAPDWTETLRGPGRLMDAEQSNSSLVFANRLILKLFRRLQPGENPELEVTRALASKGFDACPEPLGWIEGLGSTLGVLQRYYAGSVEGWKLAVERVADHFESEDPGNFAGEARELGRLTAELHAALAAALPKVTEGQPDLGRLDARLMGQLTQVAALVPELAPQRRAIEEAYAEAVRGISGTVHLQRIHGDYHLGQVLRTGERWIVIDFEGEPARSLEERRRITSPLQDVAGMLRSFDYAAHSPLVLGEDPDTPGPSPRELSRLGKAAQRWIEASRTAFLDAYLSRASAGGWLPDRPELLLRAYELDKAVYEVMYEARHRPPWLTIPLGGIQRLLGNTTATLEAPRNAPS